MHSSKNLQLLKVIEKCSSPQQFNRKQLKQMLKIVSTCILDSTVQNSVSNDLESQVIMVDSQNAIEKNKKQQVVQQKSSFSEIKNQILFLRKQQTDMKKKLQENQQQIKKIKKNIHQNQGKNTKTIGQLQGQAKEIAKQINIKQQQFLGSLKMVQSKIKQIFKNNTNQPENRSQSNRIEDVNSLRKIRKQLRQNIKQKYNLMGRYNERFTRIKNTYKLNSSMLEDKKPQTKANRSTVSTLPHQINKITHTINLQAQNQEGSVLIDSDDDLYQRHQPTKMKELRKQGKASRKIQMVEEIQIEEKDKEKGKESQLKLSTANMSQKPEG